MFCHTEMPVLPGILARNDLTKCPAIQGFDWTNPVFAGSPILLITHMITDRIGFHSVLLPLLIIIIIIIIIIISFITVFAGVLFVHQPGANHAPRASVTQVNHSVHTLNTFLRIRTDPSIIIVIIIIIIIKYSVIINMLI